MPAATTSHTVQQHFVGRDPVVAAIYAKILTAAAQWGTVREDAKKTSIHLMWRTAFAGVATRKTALLLTLKSPTDIRSKRITKHERASANRWYLYIRLESPNDVDQQLVAWLEKSYELAG